MNSFTDLHISLLINNERRNLIFPRLELAVAFTIFARYPVIERTEDRGLVIDVGACVGGFTASVPAFLPNCRVIAFEPYQPTWDYLDYNCGKMKDVTIHHLALWSEPKEVEISFRTGVELIGNQSIYGDGIQKHKVQAVRLDDVIKERVHLMKVDVEGAELDVLRGSERILRECHPILLVEMRNAQQKLAGRTNIDVIEYLESLGYNDRCFYSPGDIVFMVK